MMKKWTRARFQGTPYVRFNSWAQFFWGQTLCGPHTLVASQRPGGTTWQLKETGSVSGHWKYHMISWGSFWRQIPRHSLLGNMMLRGQQLGQEIQPVLWKSNEWNIVNLASIPDSRKRSNVQLLYSIIQLMGAWGFARHRFWTLLNFRATLCWHCDRCLLWVGAIYAKGDQQIRSQVEPGSEGEMSTSRSGLWRKQGKDWGQVLLTMQERNWLPSKAHRPLLYLFIQPLSR